MTFAILQPFLKRFRRVAKFSPVHLELAVLIALLLALGAGIALFWTLAWIPVITPSEEVEKPPVSIPLQRLSEVKNALAERDARYHGAPPFEPAPEAFR